MLPFTGFITFCGAPPRRTAIMKDGAANTMQNWPDWYADYVIREQTGQKLPA